MRTVPKITATSDEGLLTPAKVKGKYVTFDQFDEERRHPTLTGVQVSIENGHDVLMVGTNGRESRVANTDLAVERARVSDNA